MAQMQPLPQYSIAPSQYSYTQPVGNQQSHNGYDANESAGYGYGADPIYTPDSHISPWSAQPGSHPHRQAWPHPTEFRRHSESYQQYTRPPSQHHLPFVPSLSTYASTHTMSTPLTSFPAQTWSPISPAPHLGYPSPLPSSTVSSQAKMTRGNWPNAFNEGDHVFRRPHLSRVATMPSVGLQSATSDEGLEEDVAPARRYSVLGFVQRPSFDTSIPTPAEQKAPSPVSVLKDTGEVDDDDLSDVDITEGTPMPSEQSQRELSSMLIRYATQDDRRTRTFTTYLDSPSILATYRPSLSGSPLNDEKVARIFCHFLSVTGPCLSLFERQASNSPITFSNVAVPPSQKMLWTYTLPSVALHHPALLHAMLALSSLHIAKIQGTSDDPSLKHFTYAVRRVGKLLGLPKRRHEVTTLATVLLLGFYEVMSADHSRWNLHLAGAKDLVMEFDFAGMTRTTKRMRNQAKANFAQRYASSYEEHVQIAGIPETLLNDVDWEIDEELVSQFTGFHIRYENQSQPNFRRQTPQQDFSEKDIEDYKIKSDLHWWYCKQDVFQGMVSGDPLLMPFQHWLYCPPRGQIGKKDATYATMDYLCLLMGRLTDFGGKDRPRKQRVLASQGGQWRPPPWLFGGPKAPNKTGTPTGRRGSDAQVPDGHALATNGSKQNSPNGVNGILSSTIEKHTPTTRLSSKPPAMPSVHNPPMYGMMPLPKEPVEMTSAFGTMDANIHDPAFSNPMPPPEQGTGRDLETETAAAFTEHSAIVKAFDLFAQSLGPELQALPPDTNPPISTPFGPALQYRTYPIACIWAFYNVGRILIHRMHPEMPPAAMVSVGIVAHLTKDYAQTVGRICGGLYIPQQYSMQNGTLNPHLGSALMESTFFLLFAGIQFQDAAQRGWAISKLSEISKMTGWQTSAAVAAACETAWHKMGEAGRGPPYKLTMDRNNKDVRVRAMFDKGGAEAVQAAQEAKEAEGKTSQDVPTFLSHHRQHIDKNPASRVHWALGLLSVEEDIAKLSLGKA